MDHLLWSSQFEDADWLLPELPEDKRRVAAARLALMKQSSSAPSLVNALPRSEREDVGLIFDHVRYLRRAGRNDEALDLLLTLKNPGSAPYPERWWIERNYLAREALEEQKYDKAHAVLADTGLKEGTSLADAEWLAGWIALRFLKKPELAITHFERLASGVSYPISVARAHYWAGRSAEAMGHTTRAIRAYSQASQYPYTFYGQLGAESSLLSNQKLDLPATADVDPAMWASFINNELITAIRLLKEIDGERYMRTLGYYLADRSQSTGDLVLLTELFRQIGQTAISVRIAKRASQQHLLLTEYLYPVLDLPAYMGTLSAPEPALILALARQESEFNPRAVSSAGARGIMQLMPSTAQITARKNGIPFRPAALIEDPVYNMQIGMAHVADLLAYYNGSYVLTAAAYNAGANNVDRWIRQNGDPRTSGIDPIDWIEAIPFTETRNYVQRVLENAVVYRQRIAGRPVRFTLVADLKRTSQTPPDLSYLDQTPAAATPAQKADTTPASSGASAPAPQSAPVAPEAQPLEAPAAPQVAAPQSFGGTPDTLSSAPGSLGVVLSIPEADPETGEAEGTTQSIPGTPPLDRNWKIPADCQRFIIREDQSAECID
jgi:soluble lytic murein transglycosylase